MVRCPPPPEQHPSPCSRLGETHHSAVLKVTFFAVRGAPQEPFLGPHAHVPAVALSGVSDVQSEARSMSRQAINLEPSTVSTTMRIQP